MIRDDIEKGYVKINEEEYAEVKREPLQIIVERYDYATSEPAGDAAGVVGACILDIMKAVACWVYLSRYVA